MTIQFLESAARSVFHASWQAGILAIVAFLVCRRFREFRRPHGVGFGSSSWPGFCSPPCRRVPSVCLIS